MSNTAKTEYHRPDGWHDTQRLARKARPAGRALVAFAADLELDRETVEDFAARIMLLDGTGYDEEETR